VTFTYEWRRASQGKAKGHAFLLIGVRPFVRSVCGWGFLSSSSPGAAAEQCEGCVAILFEAQGREERAP
jgi:hypothetical protein